MGVGGAPVTPVDKDGNVIGGADSPNTVQGADSAGATPTANPVLVAGSDGSAVNTVLVDSDGFLTALVTPREGASFAVGRDVSNNITTILTDAVGTNIGSAAITRIAPTASALQYAGVTGGITNTSDVAMFAAAGLNVRNYCTGIQFANSAAVASEIVIKDGSTVIWRGYVPATTANQNAVGFNPPLKGTANTAMNVAMITTATATRVSAQGYTGA